MAVNILVYRDTVGARSEAFVERQYRAFKALKPFYVGTKRGPSAPRDAVILALAGLFGTWQRFKFRHLGKIPSMLSAALAEKQPRLIHAQFGLGGALALPIARKTGVPLVVTFHGGDATKDKHYENSGRPTIFQRRREALIAEAHTIFCVSHFVRETLIARGFPESKLEVHYIGIDIPDSVMLAPTGTSSGVLFVGRLVEKKGLDMLIDAMAAVRVRDPSLELTVIGDGPLRGEMEKRASSAGVKAQFLGWLGEAEVRKAMRRAMVLAVPSRTAAGGDSEGLPTVIMEAMAVGTPVIGTRHAGIPEIVSDRVSGLLVPENDPTALADAILAVKNDSALASRLRGEAYADVRARFDAKRQSALLERRLLEIIG